MRILIDNGNALPPCARISGIMGGCGKHTLRAAAPPLYHPCSQRKDILPPCGDRQGGIGYDILNYLIPLLAKEAAATEALKAADPMKWVGLTNNCKARAEEIIRHELIYV